MSYFMRNGQKINLLKHLDEDIHLIVRPQQYRTGKLDSLGRGDVYINVFGTSTFWVSIRQETITIWNNDYPGCAEINGELIDAETGDVLETFYFLGPNIPKWKYEYPKDWYMQSMGKYFTDLNPLKKYIVHIFGRQVLDDHYMARGGYNYITYRITK